MQPARRAEELIAATCRVKELATRLMTAYGALPPLLEQEHALIAAGKLGAVDSIVEGKEQVGAEVESAFRGLTQVSAEIARLGTLFNVPMPAPATLSAAVDSLETLVASLGEQGLAVEVARRQILTAREVVAAFMALYQKVKPRVDANKYLLDRLLDNLRLSYRFWQEMTEQVAISYDAQGARQSKGRHSGFLVRA